MSEQEQVETVPSVEVAETKEESLDEVLKEFSVEDTAKSFVAQPNYHQPVQQEKPPELNIPDPSYDPDGFRQTMKSLHTNDWEVKQTLNRISQHLEGQAKEQQRKVEEADISKAIEKIQESVPVLKGKNTVVKGILGALASEKPAIMKVWENRYQNPNAWDKTLAAITKQVAKEFDFVSDPQLTESVRAAKASRDQMATTTKRGPNDQWDGLDSVEFEKAWRRLVNT